MKEKLVLVGAGSAMFTRGILADLLNRGWEVDLALVDTDPEALSVAEGLARKMVTSRMAPVEVTASTRIRDVLKNATVIICTVGVGGRRAWEKDVLIPRKYGVYQPVGDTVMPGGTSRVLRMIPAMVKVAESVLDLAPEALFINYGNPMGPVCRGIHKATGAAVLGLCIGVHEVARYLAAQLGAAFEDFKYTAVGMNHLTWFLEARVKGRDVSSRLHEIGREKLEGTVRDAEGREIEEKTVGDAPARDNPFCWRLHQIFGAFPAVFDRHVVEFFTQFFGRGEYVEGKLGVDVYNFEDLIARGDKTYEEMRTDALSDKPLGADYFQKGSGEHQRALEIIDAVRRDTGTVFSVNLPNHGRVPDWPDEAVLEGPATATSSGLKPLAVRPVPSGIKGTLATRLMWVETSVEAALEGNRDKFTQALILDGAVGDIDSAAALTDELIEAQREYLPQFDSSASGKEHAG